jgi:hypothetical protein
MTYDNERRTAVLLSCKTRSDANKEELLRLLGEPLDWDYLFHTLARHKTIFIAWENLLRWDCIQQATRTSGLLDFWHIFYWQMHHANSRRSRIFIDNAVDVFSELERNGVQCAAIKGGALIGDIYSVGERFLHDIDFLIPRSQAGRCQELMTSLGYQYGVYRYATHTIEPLDRRMERAWVFQMHNLPSFYKLPPDPDVPYLKFQAGWDFFDSFEEYHMPSDDVLGRRVPKSDGLGLYVPDRGDQFINACAHIFREGVSTVYNDYKINWQLSKLIDLVEILEVIKADIHPWAHIISDRVKQYGLAEPVGYALACCQKVIGGDSVEEWANRYPVEDELLSELRDGKRRYPAKGSLIDRVFADGRISLEAQGGWSRQFAKDQY